MVAGTREIPSAEYLAEALSYEPHSGKLYWKTRPEAHFVDAGYSAARKCAAWNSRFAGTEAFCTRHICGYLAGKIDGQTLMAHRVIFKMIHGFDPIEVDHVNGYRDDNRKENLRSVSSVENGRNKGMHPCNTSGINGVHWDKKSQKWFATSFVEGRARRLGTFDTKEAASESRKTFEMSNGYQPLHGRRGSHLRRSAAQ